MVTVVSSTVVVPSAVPVGVVVPSELDVADVAVDEVSAAEDEAPLIDALLESPPPESSDAQPVNARAARAAAAARLTERACMAAPHCGQRSSLARTCTRQVRHGISLLGMGAPWAELSTEYARLVRPLPGVPPCSQPQPIPLPLPMASKFIVLPLLVQIVLTIALYFALSAAKGKASRAGQVDEERRALHADAWPESVLKINNCIRNQFEVPVLFFVAVLMLWKLGAVDAFVHVAAWMFVASRIAHAIIHTGSNFVPLRRRLFTFGVVVTLVLSLYAAVRLF